MLGYSVAMLLLVGADYAANGKLPGYDGWLYREASATWLAGGDPWSVGVSHAHFAGAPTTILSFVPAVVIPGDAFRWLFVGVCLAAAVYALRRIGLPLYWLLYAPLGVAVILGQPGVLVLALLVSVPVLAPLIKPFAGLPLLWRPRDAGLAIAGAVVTMLAATDLWLDWWRRLPALSARLTAELHGAEPLPVVIGGAAALVIVAWRRPQHARWLAVAALWPLPEYHYAILALPTRLPWLLLLMAVVPGPIPVIAYAVWILAHDWWMATEERPLGREGHLEGHELRLDGVVD